MAYRAQLDEKYPPPETKAFRYRVQKNNKTGGGGVSETFMRSRNGKKIPCFTVTWRPEKGRSRTANSPFRRLAGRKPSEWRWEFRRLMEEEMRGESAGE